MCRKTQLIGIILASAGVGFILSSLISAAVLRIILGITAVLAGLILIKR